MIWIAGEITTQRINYNPNFLYKICFPDECTFLLSGDVNRHICIFWNDINPHLLRETYTQHTERILGDDLTGPLFVHGTLNGKIFLHMVENVIDSLIIEKLKRPLYFNSNYISNNTELLLTKPHYLANTTICNTLVVGLEEDVLWSSPDLNPLVRKP